MLDVWEKGGEKLADMEVSGRLKEYSRFDASPEVDPLKVVLGDRPISVLEGLQLVLEVPGPAHPLPDRPQ